MRSVPGNSYGRIQAMVESGNTEWDIVEVLPDFQWIGAEKNLLEPIDFGVVDKSPIMEGQDLITDYSVPQVLFFPADRLQQGSGPRPQDLRRRVRR